MEEKLNIAQSIQDLLNEKRLLLLKNKNSLQEDLRSETKSSMGDKYETSRAQLHLEIEKWEMQENQIEAQILQFKNINFKKKCTSVELGALVYTSSSLFLIAVGLGEVKWNHGKMYCISLESPIGNMMKGKKTGDTFSFGDYSFKIEKIV